MNRRERRAARRSSPRRIELPAPPGEVHCPAGHLVLLGGRPCRVCGACV